MREGLEMRKEMGPKASTVAGAVQSHSTYRQQNCPNAPSIHHKFCRSRGQVD